MRLEKIIFWGAGGPPPVIRCQTTQLAPSVNVPRIRRRLVARFGSKPFLDEIHSILSFCVGRMSISMGKWEALDGFPNQEHRSTSGDVICSISNVHMTHAPAPRVRLQNRESAATSAFEGLSNLGTWEALDGFPGQERVL